MNPEYDFKKGKRGAVVQQKGKTRITMYIDDDVLREFRERADKSGRGYQTIINQVLREYLDKWGKPIDEEMLRRVIREELRLTAPPVVDGRIHV
ncbi:CopG family transcriptional regulator [Candidatus Desulfarcum epimagneticum]|uniref:CopG family transcriptional regulator n=1 Tax=uncultured Desulfobacteraceae bacterium TaxID=218296 RepID=A0A484HBL0_9BACT|nr:CopG family transcriptional regulator [uncultured Desulfobacteraceae bacterium]